ncbi:MAG: hypothetical protein LBQ34_02245 [Alphaproteobacteria bacterium]|jgi:hypothetical protein|nr:hypothetical protein [Alphaproteobacteria bacterium]
MQKLIIFLTIMLLASINLNAMLSDVGKSKYKTNPYNNATQNSLIISAGGVDTAIRIPYKYSQNTEYSNQELSNFKINANASIAYLRKVSSKLSVGLEFGMFAPATATIPNVGANNFQSTSKLNNKTLRGGDMTVDTNTNLCDYLQVGKNDNLKAKCNSNGGVYTACDVIGNTGGYYTIKCINGVVDRGLCDWNQYGTDLYPEYCDGSGISDMLGICQIAGKGVFSLRAVINKNGSCSYIPIFDKPTENEVCGLYPQLCTPPSIEDVCAMYPSLCSQNPPTEEEICGLFPELCTPPTMDEICNLYPSVCEEGIPPSIEEVCNLYPNLCATGGGGGNTRQAISISSSSYVAYFLVNYELFREYGIGLSIECGLGGIYRDMKLRGAVSGSGQAVALAAKTGAVGSYYLGENIALGVGVHYVYTGEQEFKNLGKNDKFQGYDFKIKSDRIITYNLRLTYLF